jgi:anti-sigma factor RsiW
MNCEQTKRALVAWHFAELSAVERREVEVHVAGCTACVAEFIALKRAVELAEEGPRPSASARTKLREAVAAELGLRWQWWERPVAFFVASASVLAALIVMQH